MMHQGRTEDGKAQLEKLLLEPVLQEAGKTGEPSRPPPASLCTRPLSIHDRRPDPDSSGSLSSLGHLRFLVLKNLAEATAACSPTRGLELFAEAALLQPDDVNLWCQVAVLVSCPQSVSEAEGNEGRRRISARD